MHIKVEQEFAIIVGATHGDDGFQMEPGGSSLPRRLPCCCRGPGATGTTGFERQTAARRPWGRNGLPSDPPGESGLPSPPALPRQCSQGGLVTWVRSADSGGKRLKHPTSRYLLNIFENLKVRALNRYTRILMATSELKFMGDKEAGLYPRNKCQERTETW